MVLVSWEFCDYANKLQTSIFLNRSAKPIISLLASQQLLVKVVLNPLVPWPIRLAGAAGIATIVYINRDSIKFEAESFSQLTPAIKLLQVVVPILMVYGIAPVGLGLSDLSCGALCFFLASRTFVDPVNRALVPAGEDSRGSSFSPVSGGQPAIER